LPDHARDTETTRRVQGFSYGGQYRYLLTFCTANVFATSNTPISSQPLDREFSKHRSRRTSHLLRTAFMPDHLHLVVEALSDGADFLRFVKIGKQRVVYSLRGSHGVRNVWRRDFTIRYCDLNKQLTT
jgi:hypothetical protein